MKRLINIYNSDTALARAQGIVIGLGIAVVISTLVVKQK